MYLAKPKRVLSVDQLDCNTLYRVVTADKFLEIKHLAELGDKFYYSEQSRNYWVPESWLSKEDAISVDSDQRTLRNNPNSKI